MRKIFYLLVIAFLACGCASTVKPHAAHPVKPAKPVNQTVKPPVKPPVAAGIIFGKADFRGVLKVEYVKLMIADETNLDKEYELFFGDKDDVQPLPWQGSMVQPKYFFLELPAGKYKINSISIPVGTTLATEKTDISFTVEKETVIYLGTLRVTGTDQKIKFGGVPLLMPGFDYKVEILDEKDQAIDEFKSRYPLAKHEIEVKLMKDMHIQAY